MKVKFTYIALLAAMFFASDLLAQKPFYPKPNVHNNIVFNRKIPQVVLDRMNKPKAENKNAILSNTIKYQPRLGKMNVLNPNPENGPASATSNGSVAVDNFSSGLQSGNFHLTRDINTCTPGSYPNSDNRFNAFPPYSVINNIAYFGADDGIHGMELWRSDGTGGGTFMVKDINPGPFASGVTNIIVANGRLFFSAYTDTEGWQPWTSDGTGAGTKKIYQIPDSISNMYSQGFIRVNNKIFFTSTSNFGNALFLTDGTTAGTSLVYNFNTTDTYAGYISEPVAVRGLLFFSAWTPAFGRELWRSDGTTAGTFMVKDIGPDQSDSYSPLQLTEYNGKLFFSGDDGSGRRLWFSDGTAAGTQPAKNTGNIFIQNDYTDYNENMPFPVLNGVLYFSGNTPADGGGLYKYDVFDHSGVTLVKDLTPGTDFDIIPAPNMVATNNLIYFKVISAIGGWHEEVWTSRGRSNNTQMIKSLDQGLNSFNYFGVYDQLYFAVNSPDLGTEPWTSDGTTSGTYLLKDIFKGNSNSDPFFFTPFKGKTLFNAGDGKIGTELWITNGTEAGTVPVKDINAASTNNSDAGLFIKGIGTLGNAVLFGAFEPERGGELYKSDGTSDGTVLLNEISPGPDWSYPNSFINKNGADYFIGDNNTTTTVYKSDGSKNGLRQLIYYIDRNNYYVEGFNVADNDLVYYILVNRNTGVYELWRSDGTASGTYSLSANLFLNYGDYIVMAGNTAFFTADDGIHGPQVWKSDGTVTGTQMVKNINPTGYGSYPYSLFPYHNQVYFGAYDGTGAYYSYWKTDGTEAGTQKVRDITPAYWDYYQYYYSHFYSQYFCQSGNTLFFNAVDYSANTYDPELWRTNGSAQSTQMVKNINPIYGSYPTNLVDVNGTLFFIADDGTDGNELWMSNGTAKGTNLVEDITPGYGGSQLDNLVNVGGKLYFIKDDGWSSTLWSADTRGNASPVSDPGLTDLHNIQALTAAGDKLFFNAFTQKFGTELYVGKAGDNRISFSSSTITLEQPTAEKDDSKFSAKLYPNPVNGPASLVISGAAAQTEVSVTDVNGNLVFQEKFTGSSITLPAVHWASGLYIITVRSGQNNQYIKMIKQ